MNHPYDTASLPRTLARADDAASDERWDEAAQNGVNFLSHHSEAIFAGEPTCSSPTFIGETN